MKELNEKNVGSCFHDFKKLCSVLIKDPHTNMVSQSPRVILLLPRITPKWRLIVAGTYENL